MTTRKVTTEDLQWWLELAPTLGWTWAKTYASSAPHDYVVAGKTPGVDLERGAIISRVIRAYGEPNLFHGHPNIYLVDRERGVKWWVMDHPDRVRVINRAPAEQFFGPQNIPDTHTGHDTIYDQLAPDYDDRYQNPSAWAEDRYVRDTIGKLTSSLPTTLDVGCGTGLLLELGITRADRFTGVDPSTGMLNQLVFKYPKAHRILPGTLDEAAPHIAGETFELTTALFGTASYLTLDEIQQMWQHTSGTLVLMTYQPDYVPDYYEHGRDELRELFEKRRLALFDWLRTVDATVSNYMVGDSNLVTVQR